jgi:hypothetical protein
MIETGLLIRAESSKPYTHPDYDEETLTATREALLKLGEGIADTDRTFGKASDAEPTCHLIGTAVGLGRIAQVRGTTTTSKRNRSRRTATPSRSRMFPSNAFRSVTIYNRDGYLEANPYNAYNLNAVTSRADADGTVVLKLAPDRDDLGDYLYVMDEWNYALRLYKLQQSVLDKTWTPPRPHPID